MVSRIDGWDRQMENMTGGPIGNRRGRRVLIADDSELMRRNLQKMLSRLPGVAEIFESSSVATTLVQIVKCYPDTIILDLQLPDGTGFEILEYFACYEHPPLTVILTNHASQSYREKAIRLGADHFFDKSFEYEQILNVLES